MMNQARSRALDRLRFDQRKKRVDDGATIPVAALSTDAREPDAVLDLKEEALRLRNALDVLTPAERQAIETAFFSELTYLEVATQLNQPLGTVKTRIRGGLAKLRQALAAPMKGL